MTLLDPSPADRTSGTDDQRIDQIVPLPPPEHLLRFFPIAGSPIERLVQETRRRIVQLLAGEDDRLLVVIGPCSIHDPKAAIEYASRLVAERKRLADDLEIILKNREQLSAGRDSSMIPTSTIAAKLTRGCASLAIFWFKSTDSACRRPPNSWT